MYVLCDECKNHYDDTHQSAQCLGIGARARFTGEPGSSHEIIAPRPIDIHNDATRALRARPTPVSDGPWLPADPSDDQSPTRS